MTSVSIRIDTERRVFDLPIQRSSAWIFNCYAIAGDNGQTVLVDPGLPCTTKGALSHIEQPSALIAVATHGHVDHVAGMPLLRNGYQAQTYLPGPCERYLAGQRPRTFDGRTALRFFPMVGQQPFTLPVLGELVTAARNIGYAGFSEEFRFPHAPTGYLEDGAAVPGASDWTVVAAPGHSDDSICLYNKSTATLLSGDAVLTHDGRAWFNPEIVDYEATAQTEEMLRSLEVRHLLPGHGMPIHGDVWGRALRHTERPPARGLAARCLRAISR